MSDYLSDLLTTDAALDAVGSRTMSAYDDDILASLGCLACAVDEHPLPEPVEIPVRQPQQARKCGWALSVTVAMTLASGGVAAAVADDPLAPFHYVKDRFLWSPSEAPAGWDLDGAPPVISMPIRVDAIGRLPDGTGLTHIRTTLPDDTGASGSGGLPTQGSGGKAPVTDDPSGGSGGLPHPKGPPSKVGSGGGHGGQSGPSNPTSPTAPTEHHRPPGSTSPVPPVVDPPKMRASSGAKPPKRAPMPTQPTAPVGVGGGIQIGSDDTEHAPSPEPAPTDVPPTDASGLAATTAPAPVAPHLLS